VTETNKPALQQHAHHGDLFKDDEMALKAIMMRQ
jgi:hypothetical protein